MTMDLWMWIALAAVVVLVLLAILFLVGKARRKQNTVSFEKKEDPKELTQEQKSGNYQATGGFNFASGPATAPENEKEPELLPGQELGAEKESAPEKAATPPVPPVAPTPPIPPKEERPAPPAAPSEAPAEPEGEPEESTAPEVEEPAVIEPEDETPEKVFPAGEPDEVGAPAPAEEETPEEPVAPSEAPAEPEGEPAETEEEVAPEAIPEAEEPARIAPSGEPEEVSEQPKTPAVPDGPAEVIEDEPVIDDSEAPQLDTELDEIAEPVAPAETAEAEATTVTPAPAAQAEIDDIDEAEGRLSRLRGKLSRSQSAIGDSVLGILGAGDLDEDAWEEIEDTLLMADLGTASTVSVVEKLRERIATRGVSSEEEARAMLREVLIEECHPEMDRSIRALPQDGKPAVVLVVGVNGTGKTTTTGKLARVLVAQNHKVLLGAADTFRAAAADQLETWGRRVGAETVRGAEGADPASVAFDAVAKGVDTGADVVLVDTAGRLHTSTGLMDQLGKVKRVVEKKAVVDEVILVLDATIGQNGLMQARTFGDVVDITGVALTKLDGTAKGGIVFQVQRELGVPVKLVGLGEGADHLAPFEPESFVDALLGES
nr:signal recognition particle-docking protein FtsY [Corynebacterium sputi]